MNHDDLPAYADLPAAAEGGRSGWAVFGADDDLGTVNLLTPDRVAAAAGLVRTGATFPLDVPHGFFHPPLNPARGTPRHTVVDQPGGIGMDDVIDNLWPQAGSQWDSLAHVGYTRERYYNDRTRDDVRTHHRNTIDHWARHGMVGRGVVLDLARAREADGRPYDPGSSEAFGVADLELAREHAGVDLRTGDVLLLHTGFTGWYAEQSAAVRRALPGSVTAPGLDQSEDVCAWVWDTHAAALATDTFAVEAWPADLRLEAAPFGFLHHMLIGSFGMALGELWWLADLAADCAADGVHEGLLVSAPMQTPGGISSPPNAVLVK